jgi:NADPH:quinone reductase-like Zn-dependent oxidoreductase
MGQDLCTAFWITSPAKGKLITLELAPPGDDELRVKTLYSAISRGTESLVFSGNVPPSEARRMRAPFQEGEFSFPVKYGYINVGIVEQGPQSLQGKTVFCLYPHQTRYNVPAASVAPLPPDVPPERAILAANMETAINALWDAQPGIGDRISVVGAGVVGSLVAWLASRIIGCHVQLVDINSDRDSVAEKLGVSFAQPHNAQVDRDLVFHASASSDGLNTALDIAGFEASIIELSWFGKQSSAINLGGAFHSRRLQIKSSQVGHIAPQQRPRWDFSRRLALAMTLLNDRCLDVLISGESDFSDMPDTLRRLSEPNSAALCHRVCYQ